MLTGYFPVQCKEAKIILHLKPCKSPNEPMSYRPISLLPILSKVYEKLLLHHVLPIIENRRLLPGHKFGFRQRHSTLQQTHRIVQKTNEALETKQYCSAAFLDISHLLTESGTLVSYTSYDNFSPFNYYLIPNSYLSNRHVQVKVEDSYTELLPANAGVPQGSVLRPLLYLLYTADVLGVDMSSLVNDLCCLYKPYGVGPRNPLKNSQIGNSFGTLPLA
jgi:hypothetical protein